MQAVRTYTICNINNDNRGVVYLDYKTMPDEIDNKLFFGVELEVEYKKKLDVRGSVRRDDQTYNSILVAEFYRIADKCQDALKDNGVLKWEGTVNCGFEVNSAPATLQYHREACWGTFFESAKKYLVGKNNCGMHIHISRETLDEMTQAKMICFVHNKYNKDFMSAIAGRLVSPYASWCKTKTIKDKDGVVDIVTYSRDALGVSSHTNGATLECRIFASIPTKQGVLQGIEFIHALIEYCKETKTILFDKYIDYSEFLDWYKDKVDVYPYFSIHLRRLGYLRKKISIRNLLNKRS